MKLTVILCLFLLYDHTGADIYGSLIDDLVDEAAEAVEDARAVILKHTPYEDISPLVGDIGTNSGETGDEMSMFDTIKDVSLDEQNIGNEPIPDIAIPIGDFKVNTPEPLQIAFNATKKDFTGKPSNQDIINKKPIEDMKSIEIVANTVSVATVKSTTASIATSTVDHIDGTSPGLTNENSNESTENANVTFTTETSKYYKTEVNTKPIETIDTTFMSDDQATTTAINNVHSNEITENANLVSNIGSGTTINAENDNNSITNTDATEKAFTGKPSAQDITNEKSIEYMKYVETVANTVSVATVKLTTASIATSTVDHIDGISLGSSSENSNESTEIANVILTTDTSNKTEIDTTSPATTFKSDDQATTTAINNVHSNEITENADLVSNIGSGTSIHSENDNYSIKSTHSLFSITTAKYDVDEANGNMASTLGNINYKVLSNDNSNETTENPNLISDTSAGTTDKAVTTITSTVSVTTDKSIEKGKEIITTFSDVNLNDITEDTPSTTEISKTEEDIKDNETIASTSIILIKSKDDVTDNVLSASDASSNETTNNENIILNAESTTSSKAGYKQSTETARPSVTADENNSDEVTNNYIATEAIASTREVTSRDQIANFTTVTINKSVTTDIELPVDKMSTNNPTNMNKVTAANQLESTTISNSILDFTEPTIYKASEDLNTGSPKIIFEEDTIGNALIGDIPEYESTSDTDMPYSWTPIMIPPITPIEIPKFTTIIPILSPTMSNARPSDPKTISSTVSFDFSKTDEAATMIESSTESEPVIIPVITPIELPKYTKIIPIESTSAKSTQGTLDLMTLPVISSIASPGPLLSRLIKFAKDHPSLIDISPPASNTATTAPSTRVLTTISSSPITSVPITELTSTTSTYNTTISPLTTVVSPSSTTIQSSATSLPTITPTPSVLSSETVPITSEVTTTTSMLTTPVITTTTLPDTSSSTTTVTSTTKKKPKDYKLAVFINFLKPKRLNIT